MHTLVHEISVTVANYVTKHHDYPNSLLLGKNQWQTFGEAMLKGFFGAVDEAAVIEDNIWYAQMRVIRVERENMLAVGRIMEQ